MQWLKIRSRLRQFHIKNDEHFLVRPFYLLRGPEKQSVLEHAIMTWDASVPLLASPAMRIRRASLNGRVASRAHSYSRMARQTWAWAVKVLAFTLIIAIGLEETGLGQEPIVLPEDFQPQVLDERATRAKVEVSKRGLGKKSKVRVRLRDKHELKGHITQVDEYSFELRVEPEWLDEIEISRGTILRIPYAEVEKIRGPKWRPAKVAADVGVIVALVTILAAVAYLKAIRCRHSYCS